jgi:type II secretory pathway component PulF
MTEATGNAAIDRISEAIARANLIREDLSAISATEEAKGLLREIRSFEKALNSGMGADEFRKQINLIRWLPAVRSYAWTYLSILAFLVLLLFIFLSSTILPVFDSMFKEFRLKLPYLTRAVLWMGAWVGPRSHTIMLATGASLIMFSVGNRLIKRLSNDRILVSYWQRLSFGSSESVIAMSRFAYALACLLRINAEQHEAILMAGIACENPVLLRNAIRMSSEIKNRPAHHCPSARCFPPLVIEALRDDGIASGNKQVAIEILRELSRIYSDRVKHRREMVVEFLLPIALIVIGLTLGVIALSLFMPLISLITSLS